MQKQQALHRNAEVTGATLKCRDRRRYTIMQKLQALQCNAKAEGATL
jgi:hypothetical protein